MLSYKKASEEQVRLKYLKDMVVLRGFIQQLVDTIGWWESDAERQREMRKEATKWHLELKEDYANARLQRQVYKQEAFDLKEERDQLLDENLELMRALDRAHGIIGAINRIAGVSR